MTIWQLISEQARAALTDYQRKRHRRKLHPPAPELRIESLTEISRLIKQAPKAIDTRSK